MELFRGRLESTRRRPTTLRCLFMWQGLGSGGGGAVLAEENTRISSSVARTEVAVAHVSRESLKVLEDEFPDLRLRLVTLASIYLDAFALLYADNSDRDIDARTRAAIRRLLGEGFIPACDFPGDPVEIPVTQDEIAELARLSRNAVGPILRKLERAGALSLGYRKITVLIAVFYMVDLARRDPTSARF